MIAYCETVEPPWAIDPKLEMNIQLLSARIVIATGPVPVATVADLLAFLGSNADPGLAAHAAAVESYRRRYGV